MVSHSCLDNYVLKEYVDWREVGVNSNGQPQLP